ncbi:Integrase catalytic core protein [Phytophthora palmivora]|uniref:Integrase catalytic core protein n=1 Tax=Phytophthora palmivora TaxID=4796 RepID=A0A2P4YI55_9STRA|nr:Integrase catalytic core protein [Phytophthora palmivora]
MQTKTPGGSTYVVTFTDDYSRRVTVYFMKAKSDVLSKFKIFKVALENATGHRVKRLRSDNGGEYTGRQSKGYLNHCGIKHEKTVPYKPQQNGLSERMNRSLVEMARCMLYHESVDKKWWAEAVNTAAWNINRIPNLVTIKTPYEIVYKTKPQLQNLKVFGALGYGHIAARSAESSMRSHSTVDSWDTRGVKGYRVMNAATGEVKIARIVKFMETSTSGHLMVRQEAADVETFASVPARGGQRSADTQQIVPAITEYGDVIPLQLDTIVEAKEWKKAIASELGSLTANKTWTLVPRPTRQRPIGCRWVFALKRNENGEVIRHKARLVAKGYSQRHGIDYEETYAPVAYLNLIRTKLAMCCAERYEIEQCDVDTAFLYGKLEEEIYMELPEGLQELLSLADTEGEGDVVCLLLQSLYGLKQASRVWN